MATTIYFNNRVTAIPGSYSEVDASGLAQVGLGATGVVACIGEAEGGKPAVVHNVTQPGSVGKLFREGDLLEAGNILFDPSKDPDIPAGAQEVKFVKVNPATQSTVTLVDANAENSVTFTSENYGEFTTKTNITVADGSQSGTKAVKVNFESITETFDNVGADGVANLKYIGNAAAATATFTHAVGLKPTVVDTTTGTFESLSLELSGSNVFAEISTLSAPATIKVVSDNAADTQIVYVWGLDGAGAFISDSITLNGTTPVTGSTSFTDVCGMLLSAATAGSITVEETAGSTTIATFAAGTLTRGLLNFTDAIECFAGAVNARATGASTAKIIIMGTVSGAPHNEVVTLSGTTAVPTTQTAWQTIDRIALALVNVSTRFTGTWYNQAVVSLQSTSASDTTQSVTLYGLDAAGTVQSESVLLTGTSVANSAGTYSRVYGFRLSAATAGTVKVVSGAGTSAMLVDEVAPGTTAVCLKTADFKLPTAAAVTTAATGSVDFILVGTNSSGVTTLEKVTGSGASSTSWKSIEYIASGWTPNASSIKTTYSPFTLSLATYPKLSDWEDFFASISAGSEWTFTKTTSALSSSYSVSDLDEFLAANVKPSAGYDILDILKDLIDTINAGSNYVTAARASGAKLPPANTVQPAFLAGGVEGATTFSNWQSALDTLRNYRVNTIVVLTSDAAVQAAVIAHCTYMCAAGRSERDCVLGAASGTTLTAAKALALSMNNRNTRLCIQDVDRFNVLGTKEKFSPPFTACIAAGMQAGSAIGASLTFKYLNVLDTYGDDATYNLQDNANELIQAGLCMVEKVPNVGFRWLRNVTTFLINDNLAYCEASVNEAVNYAVYTLRTSLEAIIGKKGFSGTVTAAQGLAVTILSQLVTAGAITSWKNLTISLTDDVMTIDVEIAPVIPVNFIKTTIHLVSATFEAST